VKAWIMKGYTFSRMLRFDEEIKCYEKALEIDPRSVEAWFNKALVEDKMGGRRLDAIESFQKFIELAPPTKYAKQIQAAQKRLRELKTWR